MFLLTEKHLQIGKMEVTKPHSIPNRKVHVLMLQHNSLSEQHQNQFSLIFSSLRISQLLRGAGIRKSYGISSFVVFQIIFQLVFQGRNLFRLLEGNRAESLPGKDVVY